LGSSGKSRSLGTVPRVRISCIVQDVLFVDVDNRAGVIGLQTALTLKEAGFKVVIVAKDFPGSEDPLYTSTW
jgi:heterodisulfide reductase subunit A-like polyferredoxin